MAVPDRNFVHRPREKTAILSGGRLAASLVLSFSLAGCGGTADPDRPATMRVSGLVTYMGSPSEGAQVTFNPEARDGRPAFGLTDADGRYELTTFESSDGAVAGKYIVTITKYGAPPPMQTAPVESDEYVPAESSKAPKVVQKNELPAKYAAMHTSDLRAEVGGGTNTFDFSLKN